MKIVRIYRKGVIEEIDLQEKLCIYNSELPKSWVEIIKEVEELLNIKTPKEYEDFLKTYDYYRYFLGDTFISPKIRRFYGALKKTKYKKMFEDDILKYISYMYIFGFFDKIGCVLDKNNLDIDNWLKSNNPFGYSYSKEQLKYKYSIIDLIPLKYGMNGIRELLLGASKKMFN